MAEPTLYLKLVTPAAVRPTRTSGGSGWVLRALTSYCVCENFGGTLIRTGVAAKVPVGYCGRIAVNIRDVQLVSCDVVEPNDNDEIVLHVRTAGCMKVIDAGDFVASLIVTKVHTGAMSLITGAFPSTN